MPRMRTPLLVIGAIVAVLAGGRAGLAQDAAPPHPVHIHKGTCDNLDPAPLFPLNDVGAAGEAVGARTAPTVATSTTTVEAALADVIAGGHAINVHESAANIGNYIACGDVGGRLEIGVGAGQGDRLAVGLRELNGSGYSGVAVLIAAGDRTEVVVYLGQGLADGTGDAAEGTPSAAASAAVGATTVDVRDFAYSPDPVEIPLGGTVTWTNRDAVPHTATARDRAVLQSGVLDQEQAHSETFDEAGTFEYFCEFHPNMKGTVVVR